MPNPTPHDPTTAQRQLVQLHATIGTRQDVIADILGIDAKTLRKYYRAELDQALAKANATIGGALFNKAKNGDTTAQIFWMKTRAQWRETSVHEFTGADGGPIQTEEVGTGARKLGEFLNGLTKSSGTTGEAPEG